MLDRFAGDAVSGLKGFVTRRTRDGEDPTTCLRMFSSFLESNKDKNRQFVRRIVARVDSSFFAPLREVDQTTSPDDFIASCHGLMNRLLEIDPEMPYWRDYERQRARIEEAKRQVAERLFEEKLEKRRAIDDEYSKMRAAREKDCRESGSGRRLFTGLIVSFVVAAALLIVGLLVPTPLPPGWHLTLVVVPGVMGAFTALVRSWRSRDREGAEGSAMAGFLIGAVVGALVAFILTPYSLHSGIASAVVGLALIMIYKAKVAGIQFTHEERSAYSTSLESIEDYLSRKREYEITEATLIILTAEDG